MAICRSLLIVFALIALVGCSRAKPASVAVRGGCENCHRAHHLDAGACETCHRGEPAASRKELAHDRLLHGRAAEHHLEGSVAVRQGERLVHDLACRRCHEIGGDGNRLAAVLDRTVWNRSQEELEHSIREPVDAMPRFALSATQTDEVIAFLLRGSNRFASDPGYQVRFVTENDPPGSPFDQHCGGCHRSLLADGPIGRGSAGPNLAGLLSSHYPGMAPDRNAWTDVTLREWLHNPRSIRPATTMRPVEIEAQDFVRLLSALDSRYMQNTVRPLTRQ